MDTVDARRLVGRRGVLTAAAGAALVTVTGAGIPAHADDEVPVAPGEDLMQEHGVLKRILLVYGEGVDRLRGGLELPSGPVADAARLVRRFVEDYHEKLEEEFLFPRFRAAGTLVGLVDTLLAQHRAGRALTDVIIASATAFGVSDTDERCRLATLMHQFIRMYAPHEAREDTVLFPAFRTLVSAHEYAALGEDFEDREHQLFGSDGFEGIVDQVAGIERALGIYVLDQYTPHL